MGFVACSPAENRINKTIDHHDSGIDSGGEELARSMKDSQHQGFSGHSFRLDSESQDTVAARSYTSTAGRSRAAIADERVAALTRISYRPYSFQDDRFAFPSRNSVQGRQIEDRLLDWLNPPALLFAWFVLFRRRLPWLGVAAYLGGSCGNAELTERQG
jgi:hypothetical protein